MAGGGDGGPPQDEVSMGVYERLQEVSLDKKRANSKRRAKIKASKTYIPDWRSYRWKALNRRLYHGSVEGKEIERQWRQLKEAKNG